MAASIDPEVQQLFSQNTAEDDSRQHNGNVYGGATYNNQSYFFVKPLGEGPWDSQRKLNDFWANFEALGINERKELLKNVPTAQVTKLGRMRSSMPFSLRGISVAQHYVQRKAELQMLYNFFLRDRLNCGTEDDPTLDASNGWLNSVAFKRRFATDEHDQANVFWLDGSSKDSLYQSLAYCAKRVLRAADPDIETPTVDIRSLSSCFISWLAEEGNEDWLIVLDNLNRDWRHGNDPQAFDYANVLPDADHGNVIITSRLADLESPHASLHLDRLDIYQARTLIEACAGKSLEDLDLLLARLDGLPLALEHAGAYLRKTAMNARQYLHFYEQTWGELMQRQERHLGTSRADQSVLTTWQISYDHVAKLSPEAACLLRLWTFLDHSDLRYELFSHLHGSEMNDNGGLDPLLTSVSANELAFHDALGILVQYSMVSISTICSYHMHPVLHAWLMHGVLGHTEQQHFYKAAILLVTSSLPMSRAPALRSLNCHLVLHAEALSRGTELVASDELNPYLGQLGSFLLKYGSILSGEKCLRRSMSTFTDTKHPKDLCSLIPASDLAVLYRELGRLSEAEKLGKECLIVAGDVLQSDDEVTMAILNNLGIVYETQGRADDAEEVYQRVIETRTRTLGFESPPTLSTLGNLAIVYDHQGRWDDAENIYLQVLAGLKNICEPHDTRILITKDNLGWLLSKRGKLTEAEGMLDAVLRQKTEALGFHHPSTLVTAVRLAWQLLRLNKLEQAEDLYRQAATARVQVYGRDHDLTKRTFQTLEYLEMALGKREVTAEVTAMHQAANATSPNDVRP